MDTLTLFQELSQHTEWADSVVFAAIIGNKAAEEDDLMLSRLRHIHLVQKVFLDVWQQKPIDPDETQSFDVFEVAGFARRVHHNTIQFHKTLSPETLDAVVRLPWSKLVSDKLGFETDNPSLSQTIMQVFAHSAYHRGQVIARLRELGIEPPMTDYIAWVWAYKPPPSWPDLNRSPGE
jgi:uncharacterized damage-inducible protein DinB